MSEPIGEIIIKDLSGMDPYRIAFLGALVNTLNFWGRLQILSSHVFEEFECRANDLPAEDMQIPFNEAMNWLIHEGFITIQPTRMDSLITVKSTLIAFVQEPNKA